MIDVVTFFESAKSIHLLQRSTKSQNPDPHERVGLVSNVDFVAAIHHHLIVDVWPHTIRLHPDDDSGVVTTAEAANMS